MDITGDFMNLLDLVQLAGIQSHRVASTAGGEYHSPCPACGGTNRFYIQPYKRMSKCTGSYRCRQCGVYGDSIQFARQFLNYSFQEAAKALNATIPERPLLNSIFSYTAKPTILKSPSAKWCMNALGLVNEAHENLLTKPDILHSLEKRGLPIDAIKRYKFGWSNEDHFFNRADWGLEKSLKPDGKSRMLWIPKGLVIPSIEQSGSITRLKIRRYDWKEKDELPKYVVVSGSMNGLTLVGSSKHSTVFVVESELDAYAIDFCIGDISCSIAVGSNIKNPDIVTDDIAKRAKHLFICHDNDEAGTAMLKKWKKLYLHAEAYPTPFGKDIGEAIQNGLNLRNWILKKL